MSPLAIFAYTTTNAAGIGNVATAVALREGRCGLTPNDLPWAPLPCWLGKIPNLDIESCVDIPDALREFDCRNNRLALLALEQDDFVTAVGDARRRLGADRIGVFIGTSTSGILSTELAYQRRDPVSGALPVDYRYATTHNLDATTEFVRRVLGLTGPAMTIFRPGSRHSLAPAMVQRNTAPSLRGQRIESAEAEVPDTGTSEGGAGTFRHLLRRDT